MKQTQHTFIAEQNEIAFLLALPKDTESSGTQWPLIVFLHGRGECGDDLERIRSYGLSKLIEETEDFPCIVISPQCPAGSDWTPLIDMLVALIKRVAADHNIDRNRIYLTGLSMGGRGCWRLALAAPKCFAAIVPICGRFDADWADLPNLASMPMRLYHGADDSVVSVGESERIMDALSGLAENAELIIYPGVGHNAWDRAYHDPTLLTWLLKQERAASN